MYKILIIDDEKNIRLSIQEILRFTGYDVDTADNGLNGWKKIQENTYDLVLCDVMMPEMDGFGLLAKLKKENNFTVPFIFLTAKAQYDDLRTGMNLGADDYIFKPFKSKDLIEAIESRLSKRSKLLHSLDAKSQELEKTIGLLVGHEFNTPMNGIMSFTKMIRENASKLDDEELTKFSKYLDQSTMRLFNTFRKVRLLLQLQNQSDTSIDTSIKTSAYPLLENVAAKTASIYKRETDLCLSPYPDTPITIDKELLETVLTEVIDNSFKFSETGNLVTISCSIQDDYYIVKIEDDGNRIKAEELNKYEPFKQFNREHYEQQGLGVGLALVKVILKLCGGELLFTNNHPSGIIIELKFRL